MRYLAERDFCELFWFHVTLFFDLLAPKVDRLMPWPRGPLVPVGIRTGSFVFRMSYLLTDRGGAPIGAGGHDPHFSRQRGTGGHDLGIIY